MKTTHYELPTLPGGNPTESARFPRATTNRSAQLKLATLLLTLLAGWLVVRVSAEAIEVRQVLQDIHESMKTPIPNWKAAKSAPSTASVIVP